MKFLLDENVEYRLALALRDLGHEVAVIARDYPHALSDSEVLAVAVREHRILVTNDRDFGDLIVRRGFAHSGVIYLRLPMEMRFDQKLARLRQLLEADIVRPNRFLVVTPRGFREYPAD